MKGFLRNISKTALVNRAAKNLLIAGEVMAFQALVAGALGSYFMPSKMLMAAANQGSAVGAKFEVGSFTSPSSTGSPTESVTLSDSSLRPKALIFWQGHSSGSGSWESHNRATIGFASDDHAGSISQYALAISSRDGEATSNSGRRIIDKAISLDWVAVDENSANLNSTTEGSFELTWNLAASSSGINREVMYLAIGGDDVEAKTMTFTGSGSTGVQTVTGIGFTPDVVFLVQADSFPGSIPSTGSHAILGFGVMDAAGNQWANHILSQNGQGTSNTNRYQRTDRVMVGNNTLAATEREARFASMDGDGFSIDWVKAAAIPVLALCVKGVRVKAGSFTSPTSATTKAVTGTGFEPHAVMVSGYGQAASTSVRDHATWSLGASDGSVQRSTILYDFDAQATTQADSLWKNDKMVLAASNGPVVLEEAGLTSFDSDGFTVDFTTAHSVAFEYLYLALAPIPKITTVGYEVGHFETPGSTGVKTYDLGTPTLTPKALLVWMSSASNAGSWQSNIFGNVGFSDGSTDYAVSVASLDAQTTTNTARGIGAHLIHAVNENGSGFYWTADVDSFSEGQFSLDWTNVSGGATRRIMYLVIGGSAVTANVGTFTSPASTGNKTVTPDLGGATPDLVMLTQVPISAAIPASSPYANFGLGCFDVFGNQWTNAFASEDAVGTSDTFRYQRTDKCIATLEGTTAAVIEEAEFVSVGADEFVINYTSTSVGAYHNIYLAIAGINAKVGSFSSPTSTGFQSYTGAGFKPSALLVSGVKHSTGAVNAHALWNLGASDGFHQRSAAIVDRNAVTTTETDSYWSNIYAISAGTLGPAVTQQAPITSFDSDGFSANWVSVEGSAQEFVYLALG